MSVRGRRSACPHCRQNTIGPIAKLWSDAACPVRCRACGGLAFLPAHETASLNAILYPGCLAALAAVILTGSPAPILVWLGLWCAALALVVWRAPLAAISDARAAQNRRYGNLLLGLFAAAGAIWWLLSHG
ncbi:MAG TPA: hypothetical protein VGD18_00810 [Thiobacillaceae bacterium]